MDEIVPVSVILLTNELTNHAFDYSMRVQKWGWYLQLIETSQEIRRILLGWRFVCNGIYEQDDKAETEEQWTDRMRGDEGSLGEIGKDPVCWRRVASKWNDSWSSRVRTEFRSPQRWNSVDWDRMDSTADEGREETSLRAHRPASIDTIEWSSEGRSNLVDLTSIEIVERLASLALMDTRRRSGWRDWRENCRRVIFSMQKIATNELISFHRVVDPTMDRIDGSMDWTEWSAVNGWQLESADGSKDHREVDSWSDVSMRWYSNN